MSLVVPLLSVGVAAGPALVGASSSRAGAVTVTGPGNRYTVHGSDPTSITAGSDGALFFTEWAKNKIGRVTMAGKVTTWKLPTPQAGPTDIVAGPDGNLWFVETGMARGPTIDQIGRITPKGTLTQFPISARPEAITAGPNGDLWFNADGHTGQEIGEMNTAGTVLDTFQLSGEGLGISTADDAIVTGPDGNLWFTTDKGEIGRISPSGAVSLFDIPDTGGASEITDGPDGALWFSGDSTKIGAFVGRLFTNGTMTLYAIPATPPGSHPAPQGITPGPDGNIWVALEGTAQLARVNTAPAITGQITEYSVTINGDTTDPGPDGITTGPDGHIWFTDYTAGQIAEYLPPPVVSQTPASDVSDNLPGVANGPNGDEWVTDDQHQVDRVCGTGLTQHYTMTTSVSQTYGITEGPWPRGLVGFNVGMWFTEAAANKIGVFPVHVSDVVGQTCTTESLTQYTIPTPASHPLGITAGPDGAVWFTEAAADKIGRVTTTGTFSTFPIPTAGSYPTSIATGPDGNLWFTEYDADQIGRITPAGVVTEFKLLTADAEPSDITVGSDGNLWFTEYGANRIGRITPTGAVEEYPIPGTGTNCYPTNIVSGPDGALWFTELGADRVGRMTMSPEPGFFTDFNVGDHPMGIAATSSALEVTDAIDPAPGDLAKLVPPGAHAVILPTGPAPTASTPAIGTATTVEWTQLAPQSQTISDASGMGLFTSPSLYPGSDFTFRFTAAGTYPYAVAPVGTSDPPANGTVKILPLANQVTSAGTYVWVTWAAQSAPSGYCYDVQVETPGSTTYVNWLKGTTAPNGSFDTGGKQGSYLFRSRLRNTNNGAHSGWSATYVIVQRTTLFTTTISSRP